MLSKDKRNCVYPSRLKNERLRLLLLCPISLAWVFLINQLFINYHQSSESLILSDILNIRCLSYIAEHFLPPPPLFLSRWTFPISPIFFSSRLPSRSLFFCRELIWYLYIQCKHMKMLSAFASISTISFFLYNIL